MEVCKQLIVDRMYEVSNGQIACTTALPRDILFVATGNPKSSDLTQYDVFDLPPSLEKLVKDGLGMVVDSSSDVLHVLHSLYTCFAFCVLRRFRLNCIIYFD